MITRNEIGAVIDELADKSLTFGCMVNLFDQEELADGNEVKYKATFISRQVETDGFGYRECGGETIELDDIERTTYMDISGYVFEEEMKPEILGHPIMIGDVLAKMKEKYSLSVCKMLLNFWEPCGLDKSLQQIFDDSGWEEGYIQDGKFFPSKCTVETERLKDPSAQSLGEYLLTIFK